MPAIASHHAALTATTPADSLDPRTWSDLDLDVLFESLDRTESSVGQQRLYHRLRSQSSVVTLDAFESLVNRLSADRERREGAQVALSALAGASGYQVWSLTQPGSLDLRRWHVIFPIVATSVVTLLLLAAAWPQLILLFAVVGPACLLLRLTVAKRVGHVIEGFRFIGPLIATAIVLRSFDHADSAPLTSALHVDVPELTWLRVLSGWLTRDSVGMDPLSGTLIELLNALLLLDANALFFGGLELRRRGPALQRTLAAVGEIDAAIAVASYRAGVTSWTRPVLRPPGSPVVIRDLRHPLLPEGVPNSVALAPPHGVLVTGSNMSGKSTFLRSLGLAAVLGQTINTCAATAYEAPLLSVRSCIGRADSLIEGKSYYLDEVDAIVAIVHASQSSGTHLFLFDELFRGTNAIERIAASEATLMQLAATSHIVIAATHDVEVVKLLEGVYAPFHFVDRIEPDGLVFEYRLARGPSSTRNAIALLELNGAPSTLVARARHLAERLSTERPL